MTIIILSHNEKDMTIKCIEHLKFLKSKGEEFSLILVDNASRDGLIEWADKQNDFDYLNIYQKLTPWGTVIKYVLDNYEIDDYVAIMKPNFFPAIGSLDIVKKSLKDNYAIAIPCIVGVNYINDSSPEEFMEKHKDDIDFDIIRPYNNFYVIRKELLDKIKIEKNIWTISQFTLSISTQFILNNYKCKLVRNAIAIKEPVYYNEDIESKSHEDDDKKIIEELYGVHYFSGVNQSIANLIENSDNHLNIMEVGCDSGATLLLIKNLHPDSTVIGLDISNTAIEIASHYIDEAYVANIESVNLEDKIPKEYLNYIIFGDVLEHLHNPANTLRYIHQFLAKDGRVLASIPNLMHVSVMKDLIHGNFTYDEYGLLDKTHIHFFTFNEIIKIFSENGYEIESITYVEQGLSDEDEKLIDSLMSLNDSDENVARFMFVAYQYIVRAKKL